MSDIEIKNAVIKRAGLEKDGGHGCLTAWLDLDFGGLCQAFGGLALYLPPDFSHHRLLSHAGHFIWRVMEVAGVTKWEDLPGKTIRVKTTWTRIHAIGHIVKDDWFDPREDFDPNKVEGKQ